MSGHVRLFFAALVCALLPGSAELVVLADTAASDQPPPAMQAFIACGLAHQRPPFHASTLAEAQACAPTLPVIRHPGAGLPSSFLTIRADGSAAMEMVSSDAPVASATLMSFTGSVITYSCYNTWTYPWSWGTSLLDWVKVSASGYGNHCNYANVPSNPSVQPFCAAPGCNAYRIDVGHYDSTYGLNNFNENYAAGWANIYFNIGDTWLCRDWVSTSGTQSPSPWCY